MTPKQREVLAFIEQFEMEQGYGPSQEEIARAFGFRSLGTVQNYLKRLQQQGALQKDWNAKRALQVRSDSKDKFPQKAWAAWQNGGEEHSSSPSQLINLPLSGKVAAGAPIEAMEGDRTLEVPLSLLRPKDLSQMDQYFVLQVEGDSMREEGVFDEDYVIIRHQKVAENGQKVIALLDGEATLKKFYQKKGRVELHPANRDYQPIVIEAHQVRERFELAGILVGLWRSYESRS